MSLSCVLSKLSEKVIGFLESFNILFENQFGFRKLHPSYMALVVLTDKLIKTGNLSLECIRTFPRPLKLLTMKYYYINVLLMMQQRIVSIGLRVICLTANNL